VGAEKRLFYWGILEISTRGGDFAEFDLKDAAPSCNILGNSYSGVSACPQFEK
jgi:hypothetical protein